MVLQTEVKKILVLGIAGGLAQITCRLLLQKYPQAQIIGVDPRPINHIPQLPALSANQMDYTRGAFENLFRIHSFDAVFHLGRMTHVSRGSHDSLAKRLDLNIMGTSKILDLSLKSGVKKVIMQSTFHVYGALPDNPIFLKEDDPLRASIKYSDLRDVVNMDQLATTFLWQHQNEMSVVVLRPCNIIGAQIRNAMGRYLTHPYGPYPIDYDPKFQFIHEFDMARIMVRALEELPLGVYNVAPEEYISLRDAFRFANNKGVPAPMFILAEMNKFVQKFTNLVPDYLFDYLKYSCLLETSLIQKYLGKNLFRFSAKDSLALLNLK